MNMNNNYRKYPSYIAMREAGYSDKEIQKQVQLSQKAEICHIPEETHYVLTARFLGISVAKPNTKSIYQPGKTTTHISKIKDIADNKFIDVKGRITLAFDDIIKISFNITDMNNVIRCSLFDSSKIQFRNKEFKIGDMIKIKNVKVRTYKGIKELFGNKFTTVLKLRLRKNKKYNEN